MFVWDGLGGVFVEDAHPRQFIVDYSSSGKSKPIARIIDRGYINRLDKPIELFLEAQENGELAIGVEAKGQMRRLLAAADEIKRNVLDQLHHVSEGELLYSMIQNLESYQRPSGPARVDHGEESFDQQREKFPFKVDRRAIVEGAIQALGEKGALVFFRNYKNDQYERKDRDLVGMINNYLSSEEITSISDKMIMTAL